MTRKTNFHGVYPILYSFFDEQGALDRDARTVIGEAHKNPEDLQYLTKLLDDGTITSVIDRCYPLEQTAEAHRYVEAGHKPGNVVINVHGENDLGSELLSARWSIVVTPGRPSKARRSALTIVRPPAAAVAAMMRSWAPRGRPALRTASSKLACCRATDSS